MTEVYIALGSNLGDRVANLEAAIVALAPEVELRDQSAVYETEARYVTGQPRFLNMVVGAKTDLDAAGLLRRLKALEKSLGRTPGERFGPRPIDLDILFFGDAVIETPGLSVPHPRLGERAFVLRPLADIAPRMVHPVTGMTIGRMLEELPDDGGVILYRECLSG